MRKKVQLMIKDFSSFRDPSGYVYQKDGHIYRYVAPCYRDNYDLLMTSGLYDCLYNKKQLVGIKEVTPLSKGAYKLLEAEKINFISYPYEWSFSAYKDAALLTLKIQKQALLHGMSLKDASAYNVQFQSGKPIFIDTLSFEKLDETLPWKAYKQFCQHFLAPLALMSYKDVHLSALMKQYIDGIPLDLTARLLPFWVRPGIFINVRLNARFQDKYKDSGDIAAGQMRHNMSKEKHIALVEGLYNLIANLKKPNSHTEWENYYDITNYTEEAFEEKKKCITKYMKALSSVKQIIDLGANNGYFTRVALESYPDAHALAFDIDVNAVEKNYNAIRKNNETNLLPLVLDLLNPSPAIGWANQERKNILERANADVVLALALIHHLCLSSNIPFDYAAQYLSLLAPYLIIEFISKEDTQVQKLLASREDIYSWYQQNEFEKAFTHYYEIIQQEKIKGSCRTIYLLKRK